MKSAALSLSIFAALVSLAIAQQTDEAAIRALEQQWDAANLKGDAAALEQILAPAFILTGDDGRVHTRAEVLSELKSRNITYQTARTEELNIVLHGDAAVVSGRWRGSYKNRGRTVNLLERFTNFYVRQKNGKWHCVASHGSAIK
ncbi:MAG TPA: nuclear transport factor 2 family protein [Bryobacteraceae bacterium]|nr:nuclear transport factor 2 family protein [Bryobacteraceae bacterium]